LVDQPRPTPHASRLGDGSLPSDGKNLPPILRPGGGWDERSLPGKTLAEGRGPVAVPGGVRPLGDMEGLGQGGEGGPRPGAGLPAAGLVQRAGAQRRPA